MGTDHRDHAVKIAAVLLAALLSGGCSHASYEKITAAETVVWTMNRDGLPMPSAASEKQA